jgi:hypothetical protein
MPIVFVIAGIAVVCALACMKKKAVPTQSSSSSIPNEKVDQLTLRQILEHFKTPEFVKMLNENENLIAVAIQRDVPEGIGIVSCLYDKKTSSTVNATEKLWIAKSLDDDLKEAFNGKRMAIFD